MDTHVVEAIVLELESHVYLPGDFVPHDDSLYYVASGLFKHRDDAAAVCQTGQNTSQAITVTFTP